MITSIFKKSTIINYSLVVVLLLVFFFIYLFSGSIPNLTQNSFSKNSLLTLLLVASLFLVNFIVKKNGLTKNSSYAILLFFLFTILLPSVFTNSNLLFANFFLLLAVRRLISLQTLKAPKEKIFDASIWIFIATLFHFWCILFITLVYISIIFHASRDYRNWLLPFVAFITTAIIFIFSALLFDTSWIDYIIKQSQINFQVDFFTTNFQNLALSFYAIIAVYFLFSMVFSLTNRPLILQASYKKMIFGFLIGLVIFLISPEKNNAILLFTFFPLAVMGTNNIEYAPSKMYQEIVLFTVLLGCLLAFFGQL
jgi:hypothetical protein